MNTCCLKLDLPEFFEIAMLKNTDSIIEKLKALAAEFQIEFFVIKESDSRSAMLFCQYCGQKVNIKRSQITQNITTMKPYGIMN